MNRFSTTLALTLGLTAPTWSSPAQAQRSTPQEQAIEMTIGDTHVIRNDGATSYDPGNESVASVAFDEATDNYVVRARAQGESTLTLLYAGGREVRHRITVRGRQVAAGGTEIVARDDVRLDLYFVELRESGAHNIGIAWPTSFPPVASAGGGGGGSPLALQANIDLITGTLSNATATITEAILPRLDLLQSSGWARILRQAALVTVNGQSARIDSGGEVNVLVTAGLVSQLQRITYGTILEMTPRYDSNTGRVEVSIHADVSDLTPSASGGGAPGRSRTEVETTVNLALGQAIVLGGLVARSTTQTQSGWPGVSQIPILGVLFGTNSRRDEAQETFVFVIPTVTQAVSRADQDRIRETLRMYESFGSIGGSGLNDIELIEPTPPGYEARPAGAAPTTPAAGAAATGSRAR